MKNGGKGLKRDRGEEGYNLHHLSSPAPSSRNGSPPIVTPSTSLGMINVCQRIQDHTPQQHTDHAPQQPSHTHSIERVDHTLSSGAETEESGSRSATPDDEVCENTSTVS